MQSSHQIHYRVHVARKIDDIKYSDEVRTALDARSPLVALESTIISHGLPRPQNLKVAQEVEAIVRSRGATPATIAIIDGTVSIGLDPAELAAIANRDDIVKASSRDLAIAVANKMSAATTVAATAHLAVAAGIPVFATGGLGGVHRGAFETYDESADLTALSGLDITVVCAGVKSILDVGATLERLETLAIAVVGYKTLHFPGFYLTDSGFLLEHCVESADEIADILAARSILKTNNAALLVTNPVLNQMDPALHEKILQAGLKAVASQGITGKSVTPFLLEFFHSSSAGESLRVNIEIIKSNAALAADIAVARAGR
ncbi:MAG: pseudouridine-5'-phosphate glycosidase [Actinobacteria bacterium]|nr:pseudouridine-5'-phosphate glycosidase [Actinomycetota bacterium]